MTAETITRDNLNDFLVAYVDGELSAEQMRRMDELLADDPDARKLRDTLRSQSEMLQGIYSSVLEQAVPDRLLKTVADTAPGGRTEAPGGRSPGSRAPRSALGASARPWLVAASVAFLVIGATGGYFAGYRFGSDATPVAGVAQVDWLTRVAEYHGIYAREKRHLVEVSADETPHIEAWLGTRLERELQVPDLSEAGAVFKGARLLGIAGKPVAQLIYQPAQGAPIAICVMRSEKADLELVTERRNDLNMIEWRRDGYAYVVVGWNPDAELRVFAESAEQSLAL